MEKIANNAKRALIIGAGLAGASAAYALAQQGWQVLVLDAAAAAAQGASSLPVGLMAQRKGGGAAQVGGIWASPLDWDGQGMACTRRWLEHFSAQGSLQQGLDWQACGAAHSSQWAKKAPPPDAPAWQWQADACWVKPQRLVAACLAHPAITCEWQASVTSIVRHSSAWQIQASDGRVWQAATVVLAASVGCTALLRALPPGAARTALQRLQDREVLIPTAGQVLYAPWHSDWGHLLPLFAEHGLHACNGHGHFVPAVPAEGGQSLWFCGASYVHQPQAQAADTDEGQAENLLRLRELLPSLTAVLAQQVQAGQIRRFVGVRCATSSRLPVLQHLGTGLWVSTGFGSRGLSHAPLAAEYLAQVL